MEFVCEKIIRLFSKLCFFSVFLAAIAVVIFQVAAIKLVGGFLNLKYCADVFLVSNSGKTLNGARLPEKVLACPAYLSASYFSRGVYRCGCGDCHSAHGFIFQNRGFALDTCGFGLDAGRCAGWRDAQKSFRFLIRPPTV